MVSRASSVYSGSLGEVSALVESRPGSRAATPRRDEHIPIMERTRASYRLGTTDKRAPRLNERPGARTWARRSKAMERLVKGNVQRPVSVGGAEGGKWSLRGQFVGDEAFL
jgi:hypothetical protein